MQFLLLGHCQISLKYPFPSQYFSNILSVRNLFCFLPEQLLLVDVILKIDTNQLEKFRLNFSNVQETGAWALVTVFL